MNILVIAPSWIGDSIMSHTMYLLIKKNNPKTQIDIITPDWNQRLFHRMPEIHNTLSLICFKHGSCSLKKYYQFAKLLKKNNTNNLSYYQTHLNQV